MFLTDAWSHFHLYLFLLVFIFIFLTLQLASAKQFLRPETGVLLLAVVLPFRPAVEGPNGESLYPAADQLVRIENGKFEVLVGEFVDKVITRAGYFVRSISRVPYLSEGANEFLFPFFFFFSVLLTIQKKKNKGDVNKKWYKLDNAIFVLQARSEPDIEAPCV